MSDILERSPPPFDRRITYGPAPEHFAELRFPAHPGRFPVLLMIHGGFWQAAYDLKHTGLLCADLTQRDVVTCNLEYRRIGNPGGGWPGTFQDISLAADRVFDYLSQDPYVDTSRTAVMGHSAGGHLALWLIGQQKVVKGSPLHNAHKSPIRTAISLGGVSDLRMGWRQHLGSGVVSRLMGGSPEQFPDRYDAGSPVELLPVRARQLLIHGTDDDVVPISQSENFVNRAREVGEDPDFVALEDTGHFELIDPGSKAWSAVLESVMAVLHLK